MDSIDDLFNQGMKERKNFKTIAERIIDESEQEFKGYSEEEQDRQKEIAELNRKIKILNKKLISNKNIKNHRFQNLNKERGEKRKKIRSDIALLKMRLEEIDREKD